MNSALYLGYLQHLRHRPRRHLFRYRTAYFYLDLAELARWNDELRLFGMNRHRLFSVWDSDHLDGSGLSTGKLLEFLRQNAIDTSPIAQTFILTHARQWSYVFNPVSFFYCFDACGQLLSVVAEVNNTFGERFHYVLPLERRHSATSLFFAGAEKAMHVSPFTARDGARYEFRLRKPQQQLTLAIRLLEHDQPVLDAVVWASRHPLTDRQLLALAFRHPWLTAKVISAIHWQAFKLYLKGLPFSHQPPPSVAQRKQMAQWAQLSHESETYRSESNP